MDWSRTIKEYEGFLKLEKGLSANSISAYLTDIQKLLQYIELNQLKEGPENLGYEQLQHFISWIAAMGLSARSQARILSGLKAFYRYLLLEDRIDKDPTALLEGPRLGRKLPEVLSIEEIDKILSAIDLSKAAELLKTISEYITSTQQHLDDADSSIDMLLAFWLYCIWSWVAFWG